MEKTWNNRRIRLLLSADPDTVIQFLQTYGPVIYTWMYYQVGADAKIALDLTVHTLSEAIQNLSTFNPAKETLFVWLKENAKHSRDERLKQWQIKPQRPWAWSQLPEDILESLSRFRVDLLNDEVISNSFVHEIVQATLSELDLRDSELLIRRFGHLETEEHISEEMDCSIEDVQNWLYRSRHAFRRTFIQMISSINSGFVESSDTGEIEIQDTNLEKLLSTTTDNLSLEDSQIETIRIQLLQVVEKTSQALPEEKHNSQIFIAVAAIALILVIALTYWLSKDNSIEPPGSAPVALKGPQEQSEPETSQTPPQQPAQDDIDNQELKVIFSLGQAGDIEALLEVLKSGQFTSQVAAAHFLGKLADPNAIDLLEQAEAHWYPEPTDDNAFAKAIGEILARFPQTAEVVITSTEEIQKVETAQQSDDDKQANESPVSIPSLTGIVSDFMNQPISNTVVELTKTSLFSINDNGIKPASTNTNSDGQFQFSDIREGPASITAKIGLEKLAIVNHAVWSKKDSICIVNFGGKPALTGNIIIDGKPLNNQTLYLSDTLDIKNASLSQEVRTDAEGHFIFLGVPAGIYSLLYLGLDNRTHRLGTFEMPPQEVFNISLNLTTTKAILDYPATEPNQTMPAKAVLDYMTDISENFYQAQAQASEGGTMMFENILPGSYVLKVLLDNGVWIQQDIEVIDGIDEQLFIVDPVSTETASLSGRLLKPSPVNLFLVNINRQIHIDIEPYADGSYELQSIPLDVYSLATFVNGQLIEFLQFDLQEEPEMTLDIDPQEILSSFSPLYTVVTDPTGLIVSGAQIWLTNGQQIDTTLSTGQGAFLATTPGSYTLSIALPGYPTVEKQVELKNSTLLAEPNPDNTVLVQLGTSIQ